MRGRFHYYGNEFMGSETLMLDGLSVQRIPGYGAAVMIFDPVLLFGRQVLSAVGAEILLLRAKV